MLCRIADLFTEIPEEGGIAPLLAEYQTKADAPPDIVIRAERYRYDMWPTLSEEAVAYMESGRQFAYKLLRFGGMYLHASALELDGRAYLFSGPSGVGKSTHTGLWRELFPAARIFNDDKPALRCLDGVWYAYGTPWSGKHHININLKVPLAGICFLKRGDGNAIRRLGGGEALTKVIHQTMHGLPNTVSLDRMLSCVQNLVENIPIYELQALPNMAAARLSYETMRRGEEVCNED